MTSSVFFKFKSQKEPSRVEFDGTGISVFELKREIIIKSGLGDGTEFDLAIYNEDGNDEFDDDTEIIPRSTSIIARRLPPMKPGAGRAARYMSGKMPVNAKNSSRKEHTSGSKASAKAAPATNGLSSMNASMTEDERLAAMFQEQSEQWSAQQEEMASQAPVFRNAKKGGPNVAVPENPPPVGYICYRCGEKGHWIQACPTNDDPNFDNKPRVKRTTGIPRSFLRTIEKPTALTNDGTLDDTKQPSGVMVNADGDFVVAEPDKASWEQFQAKTKSSAAAQKAASSGGKELRERGLECSIDKRMFIDPMKTPCCEKTYCNECITNALIESDLTCPGCQTEGVLIDDLVSDDETSQKMKAYLTEKDSVNKKESERTKVLATSTVKEESVAPSNKSPPTSKSPANGASPATTSKKAGATTKSPSSTPSPKAMALIPSTAGAVVRAAVAAAAAADAATETTIGKKRAPDDALDNPKVPKAPKAMQQQQSTEQKQSQLQQFQQQQQQQQQFASMNAGFPMMPGGMPFVDMGQQQQSHFAGMNPMAMFSMGMMGTPSMPGFPGMPPGHANAFANMNMNMNMNMNGMGGNFGGNGMYHNNGTNNNNNLNSNNGHQNNGGGMMGFGGTMGAHMMSAGGSGGNGQHPRQRQQQYQQQQQQQHQYPQNQQHLSGATAFANQQRTNEEDNAYFRQPVNPHRHQGRQRRARPSDYREL